MTITEELKRLKVTTKTLKEFGFLVGGIFCALAVFSQWKGHGHAVFFAVPGIALLVPAFVCPGILRRPYLGWMTLAFMMGWVMTRVILSILFFLVILPVSLFARLTGTRFLDLNMNRKKETYWEKKKVSEVSNPYERQF